MIIYAIRHGESTENHTGAYGGWSQAPLTEKGCRMAQELGERLKNIPFDLIYASDLRRAIQTAQLAIPGCEPIQDERLREISVGSLAGQIPAELAKTLDASYLENRKNRDFSAYGGESTPDQQKRVQRFLEDLLKTDAECAAVFCHEGTIKCMLRLVLGVEFPIYSMNHDNCSVSIFKISPNAAWKLLRWNESGRMALR